MADELNIPRLEQTFLRLFRLIDADDAAGVAALFAPHGAWHRRDGARVGRAAIIGEMEARPRGRHIEHLISNFILNKIEGGEAEVMFRTLAFSDDHPHLDRPSQMNLPIALDAYEARLVEDRGTWRLVYLKGDRMFAL